jgi:hypothetical protein
MLAAARQAVPFRKMSFPQPVKPVPFKRNEFFRKLYGVMGVGRAVPWPGLFRGPARGP